jgi:hypothetical protein
MLSDTGPGQFTPEKEPRYALNRRMGGPQSRSGRFGHGFNCSTNQCWNLLQTSWTQPTPTHPINLSYRAVMYHFPSSTPVLQITVCQQVTQTAQHICCLFQHSNMQYTIYPTVDPRCPRGLRRGSVAGLCNCGLPGAWMFVCCEGCVLSGRGLCDELITRPEESYRVWYVRVWSWTLDTEEVLAHWGFLRRDKKKYMPNSGSITEHFRHNSQKLSGYYMHRQLCSVHTLCLYVLCGSENKQRLLPYTALTDWFL